MHNFKGKSFAKEVKFKCFLRKFWYQNLSLAFWQKCIFSQGKMLRQVWFLWLKSILISRTFWPGVKSIQQHIRTKTEEKTKWSKEINSIFHFTHAFTFGRLYSFAKNTASIVVSFLESAQKPLPSGMYLTRFSIWIELPYFRARILTICSMRPFTI